MAVSSNTAVILIVSCIASCQGCGKDKSCFKWPLNCKAPTDCKIFINYSFDSSNHALSVEISGKVSGWLAFGLNGRPRRMGGTSGEVCYLYEGKVYLKGFVNVDTDFDAKDLDSSIVIIKNEYSNATLSCRYKRAITGSYMKSLNNKWYLISSWGEIGKKRGRAYTREHAVGSYFWSKDMIDLKKQVDVQCTTYGWNMIAVHGSFMVIAWVGFAVSAIFYARYMKVVWTNKTISGENIWFQLHRGFMIAAVLLTVIAFIIILVEVKGINDEFLLHTALGIPVVTFSITQALFGFFRPKAVSQWRQKFNWGHWAFGTLALILAAIAIITGHFFMDASAAAVFVFIGITLTLCLFLELRRCFKFRKVITESQSQVQQQMEEELDYPSFSITKEQTIRKIVSYIMLSSAFVCGVVSVGVIASQGHFLSKTGTLS